MKSILVSACLLGEPVRYDGKDNQLKLSQWHHIITQWKKQCRLIPVCPETLGGLPTPRPAAELQKVDGYDVLATHSPHEGQVLTNHGEDVTQAFIKGARKTLSIAQQHQVAAALLASRSPSCGSQQIYNGNFDGTLIEGVGVTAALLEQHGIRCFSPERMQELIEFIAKQDAGK